jgi:hypothetical protein
MARPDGDRAAIWYGRLMRIALPFGVLALAANLFEAYQLVAGAESPRPVLIVQVVLNTAVAILLIWQGMQYRRQRPG